MDLDELVAMLARTSNGTMSVEEIRALVDPEFIKEEEKENEE